MSPYFNDKFINFLCFLNLQEFGLLKKLKGHMCTLTFLNLKFHLVTFLFKRISFILRNQERHDLYMK